MHQTDGSCHLGDGYSHYQTRSNTPQTYVGGVLDHDLFTHQLLMYGPKKVQHATDLCRRRQREGGRGTTLLSVARDQTPRRTMKLCVGVWSRATLLRGSGPDSAPRAADGVSKCGYCNKVAVIKWLKGCNKVAVIKWL